MKISDVRIRVFNYTTRTVIDRAGHAHPGPERNARMALLTVATDDGVEGHCLASPETVRSFLVETYLRPVLLAQDPFDRERLWQELARWQRGSGGQLTDRTLAVTEIALWDLAGRALNMPVYKLIGAYRDKVPAYGSIMCGDELEGGLATPDDYGRFAEQLVERGYKGIKLHTWMPPVAWAPDVRMDIKACAAVREAVGPDIHLMLDAYHWYSRSEAHALGKALQDLGYAWFEEPMDEQSSTSYAWLAANLDIPICGPETASGKYFARAEWVATKSCDILRTGVLDVGGILPSLKCMHVAEAFGMDCEVHGGGAANLSVAAATPNGRWYERGLLPPIPRLRSRPGILERSSRPDGRGGLCPSLAEARSGRGRQFRLCRREPRLAGLSGCTAAQMPCKPSSAAREASRRAMR